jgi:predicted acyl esterase
MRKFDLTFVHDGVANGWLRASYRALDLILSGPGRPWHTHRTAEPFSAGEFVPVEIEILASSTLFEVGSRLQLAVLGTDVSRYPLFSISDR